MTNEEFAEQLDKYLSSKNYYLAAVNGILSDFILDYFKENSLLVINPKQQLLGFSIENVISKYEDYYNNLTPDTYNLPLHLTTKQAEYILELADRINSNHDCGFTSEDIEEAIEQWAKDGTFPELY